MSLHTVPKAQGAAFAAITQVQKSDLNIVQGENLLQAYFASPNKRECSVKLVVHQSGVNV